ncbi:class E sortase [Streptomyces calidiresistens]|uniref:Class E sortase n=2 Tax=Streptomyces calidiresistens TaxID=1485586 RepID=A0A7W3T490_9ACTN|nr:class E sortase [Streptomyces calidiresistens]
MSRRTAGAPPRPRRTGDPERSGDPVHTDHADAQQNAENDEQAADDHPPAPGGAGRDERGAGHRARYRHRSRGRPRSGGSPRRDDRHRPDPGHGVDRHGAHAIGVFGELMITAGVLLGLFVVYSLWWTNVVANQEANRAGDAVRESWEAGGAEDAEDPDEPRVYRPEDGIGFLHVPTMSGDEILVKEGIDLPTLNGGVAGYYDQPVESAMPWDEEGNFSLAAHRDGHGAKFHDIHKVREGDPIVFETKDSWYVYRVFSILPETSRYDIGVLDPVPEGSGATGPGRYITLTTCTPIFTSTYRYIVWGELERVEPMSAERTPPPELTES